MSPLIIPFAVTFALIGLLAFMTWRSEKRCQRQDIETLAPEAEASQHVTTTMNLNGNETTH